MDDVRKRAISVDKTIAVYLFVTNPHNLHYLMEVVIPNEEQGHPWMKTSVLLMRLLAQKDLSYFRNKKVQWVPKNVFIYHLLRLIQRLLWIHLIFPLLRFSFQWLIFWNINMFMNQTYLRQNIIHKEKYLSFLMLMGSFFKMCFLNKLMR